MITETEIALYRRLAVAARDNNFAPVINGAYLIRLLDEISRLQESERQAVELLEEVDNVGRGITVSAGVSIDWHSRRDAFIRQHEAGND